MRTILAFSIWLALAASTAGIAAPPVRTYAQALSDHIMSDHPELLSVSFHGMPPGTMGRFTTFAGSDPDRIGKPDDPDDVAVITKGITILDPRWHRADETPKSFVVRMPLRDASGANIGLLVLAYRTDSETPNSGASELDYLGRAIALRDSLQRQIASFAALFAPAIRP